MLIDFSTCSQLIAAVYGEPVRSICHVGAHLGEEAAAYAASGVQRVLWFEANQSLVPQLEANIAAFAMQQCVVAHPLFDQNTLLELKVMNASRASSLYDLARHAELYPQITLSEVRKVQAYRLDSLLSQSPPVLPWTAFDFMNVDTQGAELAVLRGLGHYLDQLSLRGLYLEVNSEQLYKGTPLIGELDAFLQQHQFMRVLTSWTQSGWGDAFYLRACTING
jgi:FkbM family methyltransferase